MSKCKPQYRYFGDGHIMCEADCIRKAAFLFINDRTKEQINFTGCPEILTLFYQREIWMRQMGIQQLAEQTRNLTVSSVKHEVRRAKTLKALTESMSFIAGVFSELKRAAIGKDANRPQQGQVEGRGSHIIGS